MYVVAADNRRISVLSVSPGSDSTDALVSVGFATTRPRVCTNSRNHAREQTLHLY